MDPKSITGGYNKYKVNYMCVLAKKGDTEKCKKLL